MFLLQRKYRPLLGLDITTSSVKLIELAMAGGQYRVEAYAAEPTPQNAINEKAIVDAEAVGEAIRRAVKRAGAKTSEVAVAISGDAAITKVIQMPRSLRSADLEGQVEMQADQYIPFPMDEVSYDFEVLGPSDKDADTNDVLLVATRTENVEQRQAAVKAAGLSARIVDVEAFALENACKLMTHQMPDGGIDRTIAVVDFGASSTTFSVLRNLKVVYTRDFAFGGQQLTEEIMRTYGLSMEEAGRAKKEGGLPGNYQSEVLDPFIDDMTNAYANADLVICRSGAMTVSEIAAVGVAASAGVVEGVARVLFDVADIAELREGEILVVPVTAPSWAPVFAKIKAAVSDIGGSMSHAAIVAREYGMPAVVGTGDATKRIRTGDKIRVDGDRGTVRVLAD